MSILWRKHGVRVYKPEKTCDGYTLISPYTRNDVWLIDMEGNYVHRWVMPTIPRNHGTLLPNGNLLYAMAAPLPPATDMRYPQIGGWGISAGLIEVDWEGNEVWRYVDTHQTHTFDRMENGNTIFPRITRVPAELAPSLKGGIPGTEDRGMMWTESIREVTPDGRVAWEWDMADHLDPDVHVLCPAGPRGDFTHMNSCVALPDGNILAGFRNISTIVIIDKATGSLKWQWGPGEVSHQHDPTYLDNGNILLFDNGGHRQNGSHISYSRSVEVNPATNKIEWEYKADPPQSFYSAIISSCQRLPNGNTLICEGTKGRVFEVTRDGEIVWEYVNPFYGPHGKPGGFIAWKHSNAMQCARRYMPDYLGLSGKALNPPIDLDWVNRLYGPEAYGGKYR
jgi:hypothetical protein